MSHDDATMGVTQVIRGDDLVTSTPRQILLYRAFGWKEPAFGHVPLTVGPDGRRLAKRDQSVKLSTLRDAGVDPRRLVGWLAQTCGLSEWMVPSVPREMVERYDCAALPREPCMVTPDAIARMVRAE